MSFTDPTAPSPAAEATEVSPAPAPGDREVAAGATIVPDQRRLESGAPADCARAETPGIAELPLAEQADAYQRVHERLQHTLAELDES